MHLLSLKLMAENKTSKGKSSGGRGALRLHSQILLLLPPEEDGHTAPPASSLWLCREATVPALCNLPTADKGHTHLREGNQPSLSSRLTPRGRETLRRQLQMSGRRWKFTFSNYLELLCDCNCAIRTHCLHLGVSPSNKLSLNLLMQSTNQYKKDRKGKFSWEIQMTSKYKKKIIDFADNQKQISNEWDTELLFSCQKPNYWYTTHELM